MDQAAAVQDLDILALLTRPGTYVLAVAIFIGVFFIRRIVETTWPNLKKQHDENSPKVTYLTKTARWWNVVILPALPVALGALMALLPSTFFYNGIGDKGGKFAFSAGVGWFAGFLYQGLKRAVKQKMGLDITPGDPSDEDS